jgi:hypothetical protein
MYEESLRCVTLEAGQDLSAPQFCFVSIAGDGQVDPTGAGALTDGVLQNDPNATGTAATVAIGGISRVVCGGVAIRLKAPTTKAVLDYRKRAFQLISLPHGRTQMISRLGEAGVLFDRCFVYAEGYDGPIPILHKDRALRAMIDYIETEVDGSEGF